MVNFTRAVLRIRRFVCLLKLKCYLAVALSACNTYNYCGFNTLILNYYFPKLLNKIKISGATTAKSTVWPVAGDSEMPAGAIKQFGIFTFNFSIF